ncbi:hypothetical protein IMY05_C3559000100 [Salix suchowensis]|nr:hypothetical protein IMY05_C3559000100 [Salix suchowensis]
MLLAVLISCSEGNILIERFNGVPAEERSHWRSFLVKSGADSLKGARNEELFVASHKSVYVVYTVIGDVYLYVVGKDEYDELACCQFCFGWCFVFSIRTKYLCFEAFMCAASGMYCLCVCVYPSFILYCCVVSGFLQQTQMPKFKNLLVNLTRQLRDYKP